MCHDVIGISCHGLQTTPSEPLGRGLVFPSDQLRRDMSPFSLFYPVSWMHGWRVVQAESAKNPGCASM